MVMAEASVAHTPGPWTRTRGEQFRHDHSRGVRGPDGTYVAAALDFNRSDRDEECEANARLIAAAPDLLSALKNLLQVCEDERESDDMLQDSRAAIAKAEGREP